MNFLDQDKSWNLFCEKTFSQEFFPSDLLETGKQIVKKCQGLPLSIVVIGGLLRKSSLTKELWENVADNLTSVLNSEEGAQCLSILSLSYTHLPLHLKPCFLYMGIFPEDHEIRVSQLIKLWVAEGFLKPNKSQSLEEIAKIYLEDLIDRNLLLIHKLGSSGKVKTCKIHDLLRDLALRVAMKDKFLCVIRSGIDIPEKCIDCRSFHRLQSASGARSLICKGGSVMEYKFRLLRVLNKVDESRSLKGFVDQLFNLRYLACVRSTSSRSWLSISLMWNVQTIILENSNSKQLVAPSEIWEMTQLRHVEFYKLCLPKPPCSNQRDNLVVLRNLQTLKEIENLRLSKEVCKRIPNIKKLNLVYDHDRDATRYYCLDNLMRLHKLESLKIIFFGKAPNLQGLAFPISLKKLSLEYIKIVNWENMSIIGSLPLLEVLRLNLHGCGAEWNLVEGQFQRLKFFELNNASALRHWNAESSHFPVLEKLILNHMDELHEIPLGIGDIPTLGFIQLYGCSESSMISAMKIAAEQQSAGNEGLLVRLHFFFEEDMKSFKSNVGLDNFSSNNNFQLGYLCDSYSHVSFFV